MRRLFCYTLSARAIGATVSAGALHAQGWGFESLIAHHRFGNGPRKGTVFCLGPFHGIRTRKGAELRKREAFSSAAREGRRPEARADGVSRTRHPSSPTTELLGLQRWRPFFFGPSAWDSNPPARLSQRPWPENGKNEYCYLAYNISKDSICLSYATYVHYKD